MTFSSGDSLRFISKESYLTLYECVNNFWVNYPKSFNFDDKSEEQWNRYLN